MGLSMPGMNDTYRPTGCWHLGLVLLTLGGCHPTPSVAPPVDVEPFSRCDPGRETFEVSDLTLASSVDRIAFFALGSDCVQPLSHGSEACANPSSTCREQVRKLVRTQEASFRGSSERSRFVIAAIVDTEGRLEVRQGMDELRQLLAPIDKPLEAWLLLSAKLSAPLFQCGEAGPDCLRRTEDGYAIVVRSFLRACPLQYVDVTHTIHSSGELAVQPGEVHDEPDRCVN